MQTAHPTDHGPGSEGKIEVLTERYASGKKLWHPGDSSQFTGPPHRPTEDDFGSGVFFDEEEAVLP